jgi:phosphinothricin acetyltransferase
MLEWSKGGTASAMTAVVREARQEDTAAIAEIYGHHVRTGAATFEIELPDRAEIDRRRQEIEAQGLPYFVAEVDGFVAGYAYAGRFRPRIGYRFTVEDSVYVHPEFVGRGLGQLLLCQLIVACEGRGARQMVVVIGDSVNAASIRLHEKFGFRRVGVLENVGWKFDRWFDVVLMQRALGN